jgi:hypothetical protein
MLLIKFDQTASHTNVFIGYYLDISGQWLRGSRETRARVAADSCKPSNYWPQRFPIGLLPADSQGRVPECGGLGMRHKK